MKTASPSPHLAILFLSILLALAFQGTRGLWSPDEGRYVDVALEMLTSGDYLHPHLEPERPHYTKPPLTYWTLALSIRLFGHNEWAVRLPYALAFVLTTWLVMVIGRQLLPPERAWLAGLFYATSLLPALAANVVTTDTLLTLFETLAMTGFVLTWRRPEQQRWMLLMWLGFALGFLTKGPPALLPLLGIAGFLFWQSEHRLWKVLFAPAGLLVFVLVGGSWYALVLIDNPALLDYFIRYEVLERIAGSAHKRHSEWYGGLKIYLPTLLIGSLPWGLLGLYGLFGKNPGRPGVPVNRLLLSWLLIPLAVFFVARSRLPFYLLPLFVPLALLVASRLPQTWIESCRRPWLIAGLMVTMLWIALKGLAAYMPSDQDDRALSRELQTLIKARPDHEIVFIDSTPRYGLNFYFREDVEYLCMLDPCVSLGLSQDESLEQELAEREGPGYYLVPTASFNRFIEKIQPANKVEVTLLGTVRNWQLVEMRLTETPGKGAE